MEEIWKPIKGYESLYEVSNLGRVKSLPRETNNQFSWCEIILKPKKSKQGYLNVGLKKDGIYKWFRIHRLVAEAFIPNPNNYPIVNHKDECKDNNDVTNLEWCTYQYNANYGSCIQRRVEKQSKAVNQYTKDGVFIRQWKSASEASRELSIYRRNIQMVCYGRPHNRTAGGFIWRFA